MENATGWGTEIVEAERVLGGGGGGGCSGRVVVRKQVGSG